MMIPLRHFFCLAAFACLAAVAEPFVIKSIQKEPPDSFSESVRAKLTNTVIQVIHGGKTVYEIWLCKQLPLKRTVDSPLRALDAVGQTSLLGAVSVLTDERDYRDDELYHGDYTIRFGLRPEDGNHLGTSEHLYFAVLVAAEKDRELGKITKAKQLSKASSKSSPNEHPVILSIYPVNAAEILAPSLHEPAPDHKALRLSIPAKKHNNADAPPVVFDLVIKGTADF